MKPQSAPDASEARVLLIEEHASNVMITRRMLERFGIKNVFAATSGEVGLNMLPNKRPDLILMDCTMPGMDGYDATRLIRRRESEAGAEHPVPIIGMTANTSDVAKSSCLLSGMNHCAHKPLDPIELHRLISQYIRVHDYSQPSHEEGSFLSDDECMDMRTVAQFARAGREQLQMLIEAYIEESGDLLKTLREANAQNDALKWAQTLHTLRGASANMGARELEILSSREREKIPPPQAAEAVLGRLQQSYDHVCLMLNNYLKSYT